MLKFLRDEKKKFAWILWAVVAVFVLYVFVDFGRSSGTDASGEVAAVVDGETITRRQYLDEYRGEERRYSQMFQGNLTPQMKKNLNLPQQVLTKMVEKILLRREAEELGLVVTDQELREQILSDPGLQRNGEFIGEKTYRQILQANGFTPARYEETVRESILLQKLNRLLERGIVLSDAVLEKEWRRQNEKLKVEYFLLPTAENETSVTVTPEEIAAHYEKTKENHRLGERRKVNYLLVDLAKIRQQTIVSDEEARADYDARISEYQSGEEVHARHVLVKSDAATEASARVKAESILRRAMGGEDFAKLANENSEDPGSKERGGDLGFFPRGQMVKEFDEAAFAAAPGQIVGELVKTSFGFHVIQVLEKRAARQKPFEEVAPQIKAKIASARAESAAETRARDVASRAAATPGDDAMRNMQESTGVVTFNTTEFFGREDQVPGLGFSQEFGKAVFALAKNDVSKEPFKIGRGWVVAKVVDVREPGIASLEEVRSKVEGDLRREKAGQAVMARLEAARASAKPEAGLAPIAKSLAVELKTPGEITRTGSIEGLPGGGRSLIRPLFAAKEGEVLPPQTLPTGGVVLARVLSKPPLDTAAFAAQKEDLRKSVRQQEATKLLQALLAQARERAKVETNQELVGQLGGA